MRVSGIALAAGRLCRCAGAFLLAAACGGLPRADAASLQIAPTQIDLRAEDASSAISLRNPGDKAVYGQVRVYRWDQSEAGDALEPTRELVASPPMVQIGPQGEQLVRLVRMGSPPMGAERSYRIIVDEIPAPGEVQGTGIQIRLRYSVPVFVAPAGPIGQPQLEWRLRRGEDGVWQLAIDNRGARHAQIGAVQLQVGARTHDLSKGLLGYALAGRGRSWRVPLPADADLGGELRVRAAVNAQTTEANVRLDR